MSVEPALLRNSLWRGEDRAIMRQKMSQIGNPVLSVKRRLAPSGRGEESLCKKKPLTVLDDSEWWNMWHKGLPRIISSHFGQQVDPLNMLEAGCGRQFHLDMTGIRYRLTAVDVSEEAIRLRKQEQDELQEIAVGDLRTIEFPESTYDVIYCSYVLEHINGAEEVLNKFDRWLKPGGLLILLIPDRDTVKGLVTRLTPFWFHVLFYRYVLKDANAGKPGFMPFRTYHEKVVSREGVYRYCVAHGYRMLAGHCDTFKPKRAFGVMSPVFSLLFKMVEMLSLNRIATTHNNLMYVIGKR
jgi:SAM-dependent methyltransferase